jgi:hypothetical protein
MDPISMWLLFGTAAANLGGSALQANAQGQANQQSAQQFEEGRGDTMSQMVAQFLQGQQQQKIQQAGQGLASTQMDPYAQAKALNSANIKSQFAQGWTPGQGFSGTLSTPALSDANLAASKSQFDKYAAAAQPNVPVAGDPSTEDFRSTYNNQSTDLNNLILSYLRNIGQYSGKDPHQMYPTAAGPLGMGPQSRPTPVTMKGGF